MPDKTGSVEASVKGKFIHRHPRLTVLLPGTAIVDSHSFRILHPLGKGGQAEAEVKMKSKLIQGGTLYGDWVSSTKRK